MIGAVAAPAVDERLVDGLPRVSSILGGLFLLASGMFPWFVAGAIATEPLRDRALFVALAGLVVTVTGVLAPRFPTAWQIVCGVTGSAGLVLVLVSAVDPPIELTASLGVGLCLIGSVLCVVAVFAARWRHRWSPPDIATVDEAAGGGEPVGETQHDATSQGEGPSRSTGRTVALVAGLVIALAAAYLVAWPASTPRLAAQPAPTVSHGEAIERYEQVTAAEADLNVFEPCESRLLTHGERTDVAVVLFHGLTNCPRQFVELGTQLFEAGANVVILRAPEHGIANADGTAIGGVENVNSLSPEALRDYADDSVDIATGLGEEVRVLGLSMGGVVAAWTAQERADADRVVAVAPAMTIPGVPASLTQVFRNVFQKLPDMSLPSSGTPLDHAYAGETTTGLDATFTMAADVADEAYGASPASSDVIVVLNPDDDQVDPVHLSGFANAWAAHGGPVSLYRLPAVGLPHDVIDVDQPDGDPEFVYPILVDLLDGERP